MYALEAFGFKGSHHCALGKAFAGESFMTEGEFVTAGSEGESMDTGDFAFTPLQFFRIYFRSVSLSCTFIHTQSFPL